MRRILFAIILLFAVSGVAAKEVSQGEAHEVARGVFGSTTRSSELRVAWDSHLLDPTRLYSAPTFYVVTPKSGCGFVVVAGDSCVTPILAYSTEYSVSQGEVLPANFEAWLRYVDSVISYARMHDLEASAATAELWAEGYTPVSATQLRTARWSQYLPYNKYCPEDGGTLSLTGCTQTAMAIIMHYNRWPERAQGQTEPFTTITKGIDVPSRNLNHKYDWDSMLYEYVEGEYSDVEGDAVAVLMADLGHSFQADYAAEATGALPSAVAMYENYGYSPACHYAMRDYYTSESWNALMRSEIESGRPIFYSGYTSNEMGHAFVLDGVDDNDYFHVNWGWGGVSDGFFKLDGLILDEYQFDTMQWAFLGVHPMCDGEIDNWLYISAPGISMTATEFLSGEPFTVNGISVANLSVLNFDGQLRVGVCDIEGEFKSWASEAVDFSLDAGYATSISNIEATVNDEIASGDRLRIFYRAKGGDAWYSMAAYTDNTRHEVVLKHSTIGQTTSLKFDKTTGVMTISYERDVTATLLLLGSEVSDGVTTSSRGMIIDTRLLRQGDIYTIYLERGVDAESKNFTFTINDL